MTKPPTLTLAELKAKSTKPATVDRPLSVPVALLRIVASAQVGDLVEQLGDEQTNTHFAAFVARIVAVRDEARP